MEDGTMSKQEFAIKVMGHLDDIKALYKKFNPVEFERGQPYLTMTIMDNSIMFWNSPSSRGGGREIDVHWQEGDNDINVR